MFKNIFNLFVAILLFAVLFTAIDASFSVWGGKEEAVFVGIEDIAGGPDVRGEIIRGGIFSDYIFPFELLSLLLLAALIGALYLAKKEVQ